MNSQFPNDITRQVALICENNRDVYNHIREGHKLGASPDTLAKWLKNHVSPYCPTNLGSEVISQLYGNVDWICVVNQIIID